jgi:hypothetical protein
MTPIAWLLEEENPSVRYFALRDILDRREDDVELKKAKAAIPNSLLIKKIFAGQDPKGYWGDPESPYLPKYKASYWTIMILGQLGMDRRDRRVRRACEYIFRFQHEEGGFLSETEKTLLREYNWLKKRGKVLPGFRRWLKTRVYETQLSCLTGNMAIALIRLGYEKGPRVKKALNWLTRVQNHDGGWLCPYWRAHINDNHSCFLGTICSLDALSRVPKKNRTRAMEDAVKKGAEFLLMHRLYKADHHQYKVINKAWLDLRFPWFFYNILRGLDVLGRLDCGRDERLVDARKILLEKRGRDGRWILENSPIGRMQAAIERVGEPSKWITLIALRALRSLGDA